MHKLNILLVDDDLDMLSLANHYLKDTFKQIFQAHSGVEALELLSKTHIDLVLTDIIMPEMNGIDLTKNIRQQYPSLKIIVSSEDGTTSSKEIVAGILLNEAINFGANQALPKPYTKQQLLECLTKVVQYN